MDFINVTNLVKVYTQRKSEAALEGITVSFPKSSLNVIVGPSGSGKTTLLNCIGGLLRPTSGKIIVGKLLISMASIKQLVDYRRNTVGFVFQDYNLIPGLNVYQNIRLPSYFSRSAKDEVEARIDTLLTDLDILELRDVDVTTLSGGERQRVSIAAAIVNNPELLIADEPTAQLDPINTKAVTQILRTQAELGKAVLVCTHDPRVAKYADRLYRLQRRGIKETTLDEAFSLPEEEQ